MLMGSSRMGGFCGESDAKVGLVEGLCSLPLSSTADGVSWRKSKFLLGSPFAPKAATNHLKNPTF